MTAIGAVLAGCAAVGPNFKTPTPPPAAGYAMNGDASSPQAAVGDRLAADWWGLFRSAELDQTVRQAIAGNQSLEAARADLARARDAVQAQTPLLKIDGNAQVGEDRVNLTQFGFSQFPGPDGPITLSNPTFQIYSFGLTGSYDFDLFGGRRRETESLLAQAEAQGFQTDAAYLTLTAQVVGEAVDIAALRAQIDAAEDIVRADRENLDLVTKAYKLGGGTRLDVATVQTELAGDLGQVTPLRQQLAVARHALALLVGQAPAQWTPPDFTLDSLTLPATLPVELPSDLVRDRPDIRAAEARLHSATAEIGVAQADLYPKLTLTGSITQGALHPQDLFSYDATGFFIGPSMTVPIFHQGELKAKKRMAEDAARSALAAYQQTVLKAFVQVGDSLQAIAHDDQLIADASSALNSGADSLNLEHLRFKDGKTGLLPVLDAQRSYARANMTLVRARAQKLRDAAALLYAVSRNWEPSNTVSVASAAPATDAAKP